MLDFDIWWFFRCFRLKLKGATSAQWHTTRLIVFGSIIWAAENICAVVDAGNGCVNPLYDIPAFACSRATYASCAVKPLSIVKSFAAHGAIAIGNAVHVNCTCPYTIESNDWSAQGHQSYAQNGKDAAHFFSLIKLILAPDVRWVNNLWASVGKYVFRK